MRNNKKLYIGVIFILTIVIIGLSYAWFNAILSGNDSAKENVVVAGTLKLSYTDSNEISLENAVPGATFTKTIKVKNTGTLPAAYNIIWQELTNTILRNELVLSATCKRLNASGEVEGTCNSIEETPIRAKRIIKNISIESNITHEYTITVLFKNTGSNQNYNMKKVFNGKFGIEEYVDNAVYCNTDVELTQGATYVNGQYTYKYMQESDYKILQGRPLDNWVNIDVDGWGVALTDKISTDAVTSELCTYINDKPVVSMNRMFFNSKANSIDLSSFNTSNVVNMTAMFYSSSVQSIDLSNFDTSKVTDMRYMFSGGQTVSITGLEYFNTSNVTDMGNMFNNNKITELNLNNFDTSNVTDMSYMFKNFLGNTLNLSSFDTSNVINMDGMFYSSKILELDLSNFDTSKVTDMRYMFSDSAVTSLDLSSFDTSNVTNMSYMFYKSAVTSLDLSNFDTSKVKSMLRMFSGSALTSLDLSSFDTSNVTNMSYMFSGATNLKTIYASDKFSLDNVTSSSSMFDSCTSLVGGSGTKYDSTKTDKTYAHIDGGTSNPGYFTNIADKK